jgi:hypothetical protein
VEPEFVADEARVHNTNAIVSTDGTTDDDTRRQAAAWPAHATSRYRSRSWRPVNAPVVPRDRPDLRARILLADSARMDRTGVRAVLRTAPARRRPAWRLAEHVATSGAGRALGAIVDVSAPTAIPVLRRTETAGPAQSMARVRDLWSLTSRRVAARSTRLRANLVSANAGRIAPADTGIALGRVTTGHGARAAPGVVGGRPARRHGTKDRETHGPPCRGASRRRLDDRIIREAARLAERRGGHGRGCGTAR